ncbi:MAG: hypothetical protein R2744_06050 [Bacteroidales bacterium]
MKKILFTLVVLPLILIQPASPQNGERIAAEKVAFFTKRLNLSVEEAEKFWPVYNDFSSRKEKINQDRNNLMRYANQNSANLTPEEMEETGDRIIGYLVEEAALSKEYHEKFKEILTPEKVLLLYGAELQFKTYLLNQLQQKRDQLPVRRNPNR